MKRSPLTTAGILILVVLQNPDGTVGNMTLNTTAAAGPELEPEPATRAHQMNERREAIAAPGIAIEISVEHLVDADELREIDRCVRDVLRLVYFCRTDFYFRISKLSSCDRLAQPSPRAAPLVSLHPTALEISRK